MIPIRHGVVTTRKPHTCWGCREIIPSGTRVFTETSADEGVAQTCYWCSGCDRFLRDNFMRLDLDGKGFAEGEVGEIREEEGASS